MLAGGRAAAVSPLCEALKVVLPEQAPWLDDWVDTTSMALERLAGFGQRPEDYGPPVLVGAYNEHEHARRGIVPEPGTAPRYRPPEPFDPEGYDPRRVPEGSIFEARESGW